MVRSWHLMVFPRLLRSRMKCRLEIALVLVQLQSSMSCFLPYTSEHAADSVLRPHLVRQLALPSSRPTRPPDPALFASLSFSEPLGRRFFWSSADVPFPGYASTLFDWSRTVPSDDLSSRHSRASAPCCRLCLRHSFDSPAYEYQPCLQPH